MTWFRHTSKSFRFGFLIFGLALVLVTIVLARRSVGPVQNQGDLQLTGNPAYDRALKAQQQLVAALILSLRDAIESENHPLSAKIILDLKGQGNSIIAPVLSELKKGAEWKYSAALMKALGELRTREALRGLEEAYFLFSSNMTVAKSFVIQIMSETGGLLARESLGTLLAKETDPQMRQEIGKALVAIGLRPEELKKLREQDRPIIEREVLVKESQRNRLESLEKLDPRAAASLPVLRTAALTESTIAIAVFAFSKLEDRGDAEAAQILVERVKAPTETPDSRIIQTNALSSLARMRVTEARLAYREIVLKSEFGLKKQAISMLGTFGDEAMIPVLDQVAKLDSGMEIQRLIEQATMSIRSRANQGNPRNR